MRYLTITNEVKPLWLRASLLGSMKGGFGNRGGLTRCAGGLGGERGMVVDHDHSLWRSLLVPFGVHFG
jgi:hypothetical protein